MTGTGAGGRLTKTAIRRPASGVDIDTRKLIAMRSLRALTRLELQNLTRKLDPEGKGLSRDAIAKIENGQRRPKTETFRKLCKALNCEAAELLPGGNGAVPVPLTTAETAIPDGRRK